MQLTPSQFAMSLMLYGAPMTRFSSFAEQLARGRIHMMTMTQKDFGYDIEAWHDYLIEVNLLGYKSSHAHRTYRKTIDRALDDENWQQAVAVAVETNLHEQLINRDNRQRCAIIEADEAWANKVRSCPNCLNKFTSVKDRGQCPECLHVFYASHPESGSSMWWLGIS